MKKYLYLFAMIALIGFVTYAYAAGPDYGVEKSYRMGELFSSKLDSTNSTSIAITAASAQTTMPTTDRPVIWQAVGNTAYVRCGTNPTVAISATNFDFVIVEGSTFGPIRIEDTKCAIIGPSAAGFVALIQLDPTQ